ncbi:MAG TPA: DUF3365 domain-containing protein [Steroidobacteraceae bacterium]|nr:DUF3365 domain-containing protein [Steroidobacteraceae bacterium]
MSILLRINAALGAAFVLALLASGLVCKLTLESNARREVLAEAALMMDSAIAMRAYTANQIEPLLVEHLKNEFLPQSVPFYAATQNFLKLRERHPQYSYKEATLNPTNPRDRATDWESDIIQRFRNDPTAQQVVGERETPMGPSLYLARPIRAEAKCLTCHGLAAQAPRTEIASYGSDNGFGWHEHEVVGASVVSVPLSSAQASSDRTWRTVMGSLAVLFLGLFVLTNVVLYLMVLRPLQRVTAIADRLSVGDSSAPEFPAVGSGEIQQLVLAFVRMRKSLAKAMQLLEP